ncbi:hypothetical protein AHF37_00029 [Paragonimus kellicotti]|nr:hypothetical protein AHF37_00029 [Paragonimus kellicotti]
MGIPPTEQAGQARLPIYSAQQPPLAQNLRLTSQGLAYVPTQTRFGGSTSAGEFGVFYLGQNGNEMAVRYFLYSANYL